MVISNAMSDHQGRLSAHLIRNIKSLKYGALTNALELEFRRNKSYIKTAFNGLKLIFLLSHHIARVNSNVTEVSAGALQ
jgi:hypothetical protein